MDQPATRAVFKFDREKKRNKILERFIDVRAGTGHLFPPDKVK
jgi:hypothetical protein